MGQDWTIFNLDKKRVDAGGGVLGELLLHSGFQKLNLRLVQPRLASSKSAVTLASFTAPSWKPLPLAFTHLLHHVRQRFSESQRALGMEVGDAETLILCRSRNVHVPSVAESRVGLPTLPVELLTIVFQFLNDTFSITTLSLTCKLFFSLGYSRLLDRLEEIHLSRTMMGDRLICVGDCARIDQLPKNIFTSAEKDTMNTWFGHRSQDGQPELVGSLNKFLLQSCSQGSSHNLLFDATFWDKATETNLIARPFIEQTQLLELLYMENMHIFDSEREEIHCRDLVLCNLTAGEFFRGNAFPLIYEKCEPWLRTSLVKNYDSGAPSRRALPFYSRRLGFAEIIGARICWSSHSDDGLVTPRGCWAGHRFEITLADSKPHLEAGKQWQDVSESVMVEMTQIWMDEFGDDWQYCI
ncbi:hypothetical protein BXZ70DRAFT_933711 [Cristinia sonorae]|uniref:F-box domain-containing protein n=1 Tax=Cristinia sonorae TaxID=1940300 RepID=A0A8K0XQQ0_9AGAR|nr:hypothetical protein BXZ70DRAFT_933711 [Cristinia sonorae]